MQKKSISITTFLITVWISLHKKTFQYSQRNIRANNKKKKKFSARIPNFSDMAVNKVFSPLQIIPEKIL